MIIILPRLYGKSATTCIQTTMAEDRDLEKVYSRKQFAAKLRRLADSIETEKAFTIQVAGERLKIPAQAEFNVEHERSGDTEELEFQLRWKRAAE